MAVQKVKLRGRMVWRARVKKGGVIRTSFHSRKDDAVEAERKLREELERTTATGWGGKVPTLIEFVDQWLEHQATSNKPGEIQRKKDILQLHLLPAFGDQRLDQITTAMVDRFKAEKLRRLKPATVAGFITVLKRALNVAARWEVIEKAPRIDQVKVPKEEVAFLDFDEADALVAAATGTWRLFFLTAIRTGLRVGELRALRWTDVNLDNKRIRIIRSYTRAGMGTPKSGKPRTVYLTWDLVEALRAHGPRARGLVFPTSSGLPLQYKTIYEACRRCSRAAGFARTISPHVLRHTFGAHHSMRGTDMIRLREWMGHADLRTTMIYSHLSEAARSEQVDNIAPERDQSGRESRGVNTGVNTHPRNPKKPLMGL